MYWLSCLSFGQVGEACELHLKILIHVCGDPTIEYVVATLTVEVCCSYAIISSVIQLVHYKHSCVGMIFHLCMLGHG